MHYTIIQATIVQYGVDSDKIKAPLARLLRVAQIQLTLPQWKRAYSAL
jgi:hypothetical protein